MNKYNLLLLLLCCLCGYTTEAQNRGCEVGIEVNNVANNKLSKKFFAVPHHTNKKKPKKICWTFGDGKQECKEYNSDYSGQYTIDYTYSKAGDYKVCTRVVYADGCVAEQCKSIKIEAIENACSARMEIDAIEGNGLSKKIFVIPQHHAQKKPIKICWTFGDGKQECKEYSTAYTGQYVTNHTYAKAGNYKICIRLVYADGCVAEKCDELKVFQPENSCSARIETEQVAEHPLAKKFFLSPGHHTQKKPVKVCWTFGDGQQECKEYNANSTGPYTVTHNYSRGGEYKACVRVVYADGCVAEKCESVALKKEIITSLPKCNVKVEETTESKGDLRRSFIVVPSLISHPEKICIRFGDGSDSCYIQSQPMTTLSSTITHLYPSPGIYRLTTVVWFAGGCIAEHTSKVVITGSEKKPRLQLSPNPATTILKAQFSSVKQERVTVYIFNANGVLLRSSLHFANAGVNNWTFDVSSLPPGVYSIIVRSPGQLASAIFSKK